MFADVTKQLSPPEEPPQVDPVLELIDEKQKNLVRQIAVALRYYPEADQVPSAVVKVGVDGLLHQLTQSQVPDQVCQFAAAN